jgi:hypothetical protein
MSINNPFEAVTKAMMSGATPFTPDAAQDAAKEMMDSLSRWGDLAQSQAQALQAAAMESVAAFQQVREPQAAIEAVKSSAKKGLSLTAKHLQEITALGVEQFVAGVDLLQQRHPAPQTFEPVAKGMKMAAAAVESTVLATLKAAEPSAPAKKSR